MRRYHRLPYVTCDVRSKLKIRRKNKELALSPLPPLATVSLSSRVTLIRGLNGRDWPSITGFNVFLSHNNVRSSGTPVCSSVQTVQRPGFVAKTAN